MGAMTQFVPVWSGMRLHSRRLAAAQLWLVAGGVAGLGVALIAGRYDLLAYPGATMLAGFWTFAYDVSRTLAGARPLDITERHFALALAFLLALTALGLALAVGFVVVGTLYHVVPFIVWEHRYSDRLGYERVPMIDNLYDDRLAAVDFAAFVAGTGALVAAGAGAPAAVEVAGQVLVVLGSVAVAANLLGVVHVHGSRSFHAVLLGTRSSGNGTDPGSRPEQSAARGPERVRANAEPRRVRTPTRWQI